MRSTAPPFPCEKAGLPVVHFDAQVLLSGDPSNRLKQLSPRRVRPVQDRLDNRVTGYFRRNPAGGALYCSKLTFSRLQIL